jgi:hypothetical protein
MRKPLHSANSNAPPSVPARQPLPRRAGDRARDQRLFRAMWANAAERVGADEDAGMDHQLRLGRDLDGDQDEWG